MSVVKRIQINAGIGLIGGVIVILSAMGKAVILGRFFDLEVLGYYFICVNIVAMIKLVLKINLEPTLIRFIPEFEEEKSPDKISSLLILSIYIVTLITLFIVGLVFFGSDLVADKIYGNPDLARPIKIICFASCAHLFAEIGVALLRLANKFHLAQIPSVLSGMAVPLILIYLEQTEKLNLESAIIATAIGEGLVVLSFFVLMVLYTRSLWSFGSRILRLEPLRGHFRDLRGTLGQTSLFGMLNAGSESGGIFLLGIFGTTTQVSLAGMATQLARPLTVIQSSLGSAVNPEVMKLYAKGEMKYLLGFLNRYMRTIGILVGVGVLITALFAPSFVNLVLKPKFLDAIPVFMVLVVSYGLTLVFQPFLAVSIMRGEVGRRNLLVSFRFLYLAIAVWWGIDAMAVVLVLLIGNLSVRFFNDLPLYRRLRKQADGPVEEQVA